MTRPILPAVLLFLLAPFIAEFLLGNLPARMILLTLPLALMYGTGALLIRELVRRTNRGWPTMILLAAAYGLIEEGLVTQSLFNPNYLHLRLLDYGFIPPLGTAFPWFIYVITIHITWSICVPIGLVECLFPQRMKTPWLGTAQLIGTSVIFIFGSALIAKTSQKMDPYMASAYQLTGVVIVTVLLIAIAFVVCKRRLAESQSAAPLPLILFCVALIAGSTLMFVQLNVEKNWHWPWQYAVLAVLTIEGAFIALLYITTQHRLWTPLHQWALTSGGIAVYVWFGCVLDYSMHGSAGMIGHAAIVAVILMLVVVAFIRTRQLAIQPSSTLSSTSSKNDTT